jgi:hypothetical protein
VGGSPAVLRHVGRLALLPSGGGSDDSLVKRSSLAWATLLVGPLAVVWYQLFTALAWTAYPGAYG